MSTWIRRQVRFRMAWAWYRPQVTQVSQQLDKRLRSYGRCPDRIALHEGGYDLASAALAQFVHVPLCLTAHALPRTLCCRIRAWTASDSNSMS